MKIKSLVMTALMGLGVLTLTGCVDGGGPYGGSSGVYVSSFDGPYYGDGFYRGYRGDGYRRGYRQDGRYDRRYDRRNYSDHRRDDRPRNRDYSNRGGNNNGRVVLPDPGVPHSFEGRGGAP